MASEYWKRYWQHRTSRRRILGYGAIGTIGAAGLALVGCGDDDDDDGRATPTSAGTTAPTSTPAPGETPTEAPPADAPKVGGTARYPLEGMSSGDPPTLFPFENLTYLAQHPATLHYSRLLTEVAGPGIDSSDFTALKGDLAEGLPEQPDELTYIFRLKPNINFHNKPPMNGRRATAEDFAQTYEAFLSISQNAGAYESVVDKIEVTDELTLKVSLKDIFAPFLTTHASSPEGVWFIPVETINSGQVQTDPVGTGPWMFKQWDTGVAMRWDRNPDYYDSPEPYFEHIEGSMIRDPQRIIAALQSGDLDWSGLASSVYNDAHSKLDPAGQEFFSPAPAMGAFYFNFDVPPWRDRRVRQALSMAWSRDEALQVLDETGQGDWHTEIAHALAPYHLSPRDTAKFGPNSKYYQKNIAEAKALLQTATGSDTLNVKVYANVDRYGAQAQQAWELLKSLVAEGGFNVELVFQEYGSYIQSTFLGNMTDGIGLGPLIGSPRDPNDQYSRNYESTSPRNNWGGTPIDEMGRIDELIAKQRTILDVEERVAFIHDMQREMAEYMLVVPYTATPGYTYVQPWVKGYYPKIGYAVHKASISQAWFTDERIARG